jgi:N-acetylmuramoyl-L-alanine amidase
MLALVVGLFVTAPPSWAEDCGLEPPGSYTPTPVPTKPYEETWQPGDPPLVRSEPRAVTRLGSTSTANFKEQGALAGKVVYLSAGHGFTWTASQNAWATQRGMTNELVEDLVSTETVNQYLVPLLLNAGARVVTVREADLNTNLVVVDDGSAGYLESGDATYFANSSLNGWGAPPSPMLTGVNPFELGKNRLVGAAATSNARATYTANFPADGYYNVYVSYTAFSGRVSDAHYIVKHGGGDSHFRVNQRRHGSTWVLLGRFYFPKGSRAALVVENDSKDLANNISLDAVRFGGGMGLIDRGQGVSARPRFEESSRYHAQYSGAPTTVYDSSTDDHTDDISTRSRFAAWVHEPGEDAVYLSWHTNAFNASAVGTTIYVYGPNAPDGTYNFTGVPGSDKLAQFVHTELLNDIRASSGWNKPTWNDRGINSAYFGEINPSHNSEMPAILMEVAFHDAVADATQLKEPGFRYLATRAISQAIIRYFADKDGVAPKFPPEPPTHVAALNQSGGMVKIQWHAPVVDAQGVGGAAALKYRVYQSADGLGWDDGFDVSGSSYTVGLPVGVARYFRVASVNDGGESFASEIVGARAPLTGGKTVLVVNAYDRLDSGLGRKDNLATWGLGQVLRIFLGKMNDASYLSRWGDAISWAEVGFDSATTLAVTSGDVALGGYAMVGWLAGRGHPGGGAPSAAEQSLLSSYASASKPLLFSGANAVSALGLGSSSDQQFLSSVLRAGAGAANSQGSLDGAGFLLGMTGLALDNGSLGAYDTGATDVLTANGGASLVGTYPAGTGAALAADKRQVTFGFPFETIVSRPQRLEVMSRVLKYFDVVGVIKPLPDAGPESDAGNDAGIDAGVDAGFDAGTIDAGPPPDVTLELLPSEYDAPMKKGCGCSSIEVFSPLLALALYRLVRARTAR